MGPLAWRAVPALIRALQDPHPGVRRGAVAALGEIGPDAGRAADPLRVLLRDADQTLRLRLEYALFRIEHDDRVAEAIAKLRHRDAAVRMAGALDLMREAPDAADGFPALIAAAADPSPVVRAAAIQTLGRIATLGGSAGRGDSLFMVLTRAEQDADEQVRNAVTEVQGRLYPLLMSAVRLGEGDADGGFRLLLEAVEADPRNAAALSNLGMLLLARGNLDEAIDLLDRALELVPRDALAFYGRGRARGQKGAHVEALADYNRALFLDPELGTIYLDRALLYQARKEYDLAVEDLDRWLQRAADPEERQDAHLRRAYLYAITAQYARALADADRALELGARNATVHYYRALALDSLGRDGEAAEAYWRFAETALGPHEEGLRESWSNVRRRLGLPAGAEPRTRGS